jgi:NitT/TauT family transport system permease protein
VTNPEATGSESTGSEATNGDATGGPVGDATDDGDTGDEVVGAATGDGDGPGRGRRRGRRSRQGRGRPPSPLLDIRSDLPAIHRTALAVVGLAGVLGLWLWAASRETKGIVVPSPAETWTALRELHETGALWDALQASGGRIFKGYLISMGFGIVLGVAIGSLRSVEATLETPIAFMRYVPAAALTPLMMLWLGIDEAPKITLIVLGTVFFNILMVADVARAVPRELIEASYTLGARRTTVLLRVVYRHSMPGIVDVARINLAAAWLMLVVSELLAAEEGLALRIVKAQRFKNYDTMFAILFVFGVLGIASDLLLRWLRNRSSPWARP